VVGTGTEGKTYLSIKIVRQPKFSVRSTLLTAAESELEITVGQPRRLAKLIVDKGGRDKV